MDKAQKYGKLNGVVSQSTHPNHLETEQEVPMDLEDSKKQDLNLQSTVNQSILSTQTSEELINQKDSLEFSNIANQSNLSISEEILSPNLKDSKEFYSFKKEYLEEVYQNLLLDENCFYKKINPNYMANQTSITFKMRAILVDWLIDVHYRCGMKKKTLFNCIYIIDAFLSKKFVDKKHLQLLGMAALLIACKESEIIFPSLNVILAFSENAYSKEELLDMERKIIKELNFDILAPTAEEFYEINAQLFNFLDEQKYLGEYFLDSSLIDSNFLKYRQSTVAVACCYIVMKFFKLSDVHLVIENTNVDVKQKEVKDCARELCFLVRNLSSSSLGATKSKYMSEKYLKVAKYCESN